MDPNDPPPIKPSEDDSPTLIDLPSMPPPEAYPDDVWEEDTLVDAIIDLT